MSHPSLDRLTAWVHGFDDDVDVDAHVADCAVCRKTADQVRAEAQVLRGALASPRLAEIKQGLLDAADGKRRHRGLLWQAALAATVLLGLVGVLFSSKSTYRLTEGRLALEDGRMMQAPQDVPAGPVRAVEQARIRVAGSTITLAPEARLTLDAEPRLDSGAAQVQVDAPIAVTSPAGRVAMSNGSFTMKIVFQQEGEAAMKTPLAGALVTVLAGSALLSSPHGSLEAATGRSAVLAGTQAPLLLTTPQDNQQEELLRRLEQLAARVAKLEDEVKVLELRNSALKLQLGANAAGGGPGGAPGGAVWTVNPGQGNGIRVVGGPGAGPGGSVIIELKEGDEKKPEKK